MMMGVVVAVGMIGRVLVLSIPVVVMLLVRTWVIIEYGFNIYI